MRDTKNDEKESFLTRSDINFEKWSIFTTRKYDRNRMLQRTNGKGLTQTVQIISWLDNGRPYTLTACECKVLYALFNMWRNAGRPTGKPVFFSFKHLAGELGLRWSGNTLEHMKRWLLNLRGVMIKFENCYRTGKNSDILETTEMMTILTHLKIVKKSNRKTRKPHLAHSEFKFHPYILKSLRNNYIKPLRMDVIRGLKSDTAVILYRWLDLMLFKQDSIERELRNLAQELGLEYIRPDNFVKVVRRAAAKLFGKEFVSGKIGYCKVERISSGTGWKLVVRKVKISQYDYERVGDEAAYRYFNSLPQADRKSIKLEVEISAEQDLAYKKFCSRQEIKELWKAGKLLEIVKQKKKEEERL